MSNQATNGQPGSQDGESPPESQVQDEGSPNPGRGSDRVEDLEARFDLLTDRFSELRDAILSTRQPTAREEVEDMSDDEPLTPSKVKKIVKDGISTAVAGSTQVQERREWDRRAADEFPLKDPKFERAFRSEWQDMVNSGMNPNHPRAVYKVAQATALRVGVKKDSPKKDPEPTSEAPTREPPSRTERRGAQAQVRDDDPRLKFYLMKGPKTKERIEEIKQKLSERDAKRRAR